MLDAAGDEVLGDVYRSGDIIALGQLRPQDKHGRLAQAVDLLPALTCCLRLHQMGRAISDSHIL